MAVWRTKAYSLFGLKPGAYSGADGKRYLFRDLVEQSRTAIREEDEDLLHRIVTYVTWAAEQNSDELTSSVDLAFFKQLFDDAELCAQLRRYFPEPLFNEKWTLLKNPSYD